MFTGIIAEVGEILTVEASEQGSRLGIGCALADQLVTGDSVAVNGVCLTVAGHDADSFEAELSNQTLSVTSLAAAKPGLRVNLEPALRAGDRFGGHIVQGHVDGTAQVVSVTPDGFSRRLVVTLAEDLSPYVVERGSITLDGVSLTVSQLTATDAQVALIPETLGRTTLGEAEPGRRLNLEVDVIARYAERLLQGFEERMRAEHE